MSIVQQINEGLQALGFSQSLAAQLDQFIAFLGVLLVAYLADTVCRKILLKVVSRLVKQTKATWDDIVFDRKVMVHLSRMVAPILIYILLPLAFSDAESATLALILRFCLIFIIIMFLSFISALLTAVYTVYSEKEQFRDRPLKGLLQTVQVILYFVGGIIVVSILIDRSPGVLLTGLGASAAVLMLVFKDSIMGFVSGVQLSANNMLKVGDWITMPKYGADGDVIEVSLNTVKVRNFDKTITTIPPYLLVSDSFQNWRGMQESGGRRVNKNIYLDMTTLKFCTPEDLDAIRKNVPLMADYQPAEGEVPTNSQLYRIYIERYLRSLPVVNQDMDLIISQKEPTTYGVPIQVYFFSRNKVWREYERIQSDIFDHLLAIVGKFDLKLYQYSD